MSRTKHHSDKQKEQLFGNNWHWSRNEPKEWRRVFKHKRRRAELKHRIERIKNGCDPDDEVFPLDKKPWIYYY